MSKFNTTQKGASRTVNHEGEVAYKETPELELYSAVVTSILSDSFYEGENERLTRIRSLIKKVSPEFVAQLAVYARTKMYLRTLPLVLLVELTDIHSGDDLVRRLANRVILRADELSEVLAYYQTAFKRKDTKKLGKLSNQLKKGIADRFNSFDEYQFGKYNRKGSVSLKDALFLVHPKAKTKENQELFDKIEADTLAVPYTWETELTKVGQEKYEDEKAKAEAVKKVWHELIDSEKLPYMAMLRNLRNMLEAKIDGEHLAKVAQTLGNPELVRKSKQFPFRFMSAYSVVENLCTGDASVILDALEEAMVASAENIAGFGFDTKVMIANDVSGSMSARISDKSTVERSDIGLILGMLLQNKCKRVVTSVFGDTFAIKNFPKSNIIQNALRMKDFGNEVGHSTNGYLVIKHLIDTNEVMDKVIIFTDLQLWDSRGWGHDGEIRKLWPQYKKIAPDAKLYLFDLAGYGNTPVALDGDVRMIAGWSDKIFDMLKAYEEGSSAIAEIKKIVV